MVITDLHNFATPLIRYELGDYAEVGTPCPTGRGLPVLNRKNDMVGLLSIADLAVHAPNPIAGEVLEAVSTSNH